MITAGTKLTSLVMIEQALAEGFALEVVEFSDDVFDENGEVIYWGGVEASTYENLYQPYMGGMIDNPATGEINAAEMVEYDQWQDYIWGPLIDDEDSC